MGRGASPFSSFSSRDGELLLPLLSRGSGSAEPRPSLPRVLGSHPRRGRLGTEVALRRRPCGRGHRGQARDVS